MHFARWTSAAWGAAGATALFLAITCWWLTQDHSIPVFDAGTHLRLALEVHRELAAGHLGRALTLSVPYPPFSYLVASLGIAIGGEGVAPPILAENLVFIPLLALGCYHVGRLVFSPVAGFLAVVFALGAPLTISMFHVVMVDGPEAAMVAVSLWAILATERFARVETSALAGLCVGLGMLTKEPFMFFVAGPLLVAVLSGGWRSWRGLLVFTGIALGIALPWYLSQLSPVSSIGTVAIGSHGNPSLPGDIAPERASLDNLEWYLWTFVNAQLYLPLFLFAVAGWVCTIVAFFQRRSASIPSLQLVLGAFIGWLAITVTLAHDSRYGMPLLVYLAVFGAGWIPRLHHRGRVFAASALVIVAVANMAGDISGVGGKLELKLPDANASFRQNPGIITIFSNSGFLAGTPRHDGAMLATLRALKSHGVTLIALTFRSEVESDFSSEGIEALSMIAGLRAGVWVGSPEDLTARDAVLIHAPVSAGRPQPCVRLEDGTGVWIVLGNPEDKSARYYCPSRNPPFYKREA